MITGTRAYKPSLMSLRICWIAAVLAPMDASLILSFSIIPGFMTSLSRIVIIIAVTCSLLESVLKKRMLLAGKTWHAKMLIIWAVWCIASIMWSSNLSISIRSLAILTVILGLVWMSSMLTRYEMGSQMITCIVMVSVIMALLEEITGFRPNASRQYDFVNELTGFYVNPSHLGATLALGFPWLLNNAIKDIHKHKRMIYSIICILVVFVVLRTGTKGNLLALFFASAGMGILLGHNKKAIKRWFAVCTYLLGITVLFIMAGIIPPHIVNKIGKLLEMFNSDVWYSGEGSFGSRWMIWQTGLNLVFKKPINGWGFGNAEELLGIQTKTGALSTHNLWLQLFIEGGIVGFSIFGAMYAGLIITLFVKWIRKRINLQGLIALASLLAFIPISITVGNINSLWVFWLILGIGLAEA